MLKNSRLAAAGLIVAYGVLSASTASADEKTGFYFSVWGGGGTVKDMPSKRTFDTNVTAMLPAELVAAGQNLSSVSDTSTQIVNLSLLSLGNSELDDTVGVWGSQIGYRWGKYFAAELGYAHLGEASYRLPGVVQETITTTTTNSTTTPPSTVTTTQTNIVDIERATVFTSAGPTISALGILPVGPFDFHARLGLYFADTRLTNRIRDADRSQNYAHRRVDASQNELFAGIGGAWNINESFTVRVEYQRFFDVGDDDKTLESDIDTINLSVLFR